jgi:uncharacterized hydrophobic protein (TIGR00271 family)
MADAPTTATGPPRDQGLEGRPPGNGRPPWWHPVRWWKTRHQGTTPEERRRVIDSLLSTAGGTSTGRFWAMQAFAVVIATMGMSANSAAVVIGAMLVAPLMTPIMAVATSLALGWPRKAIAPLLGTIAASAGSVGLAWALHSLVASATVTDEILSRTSPDLRDGLVALAAGAAGALGTARKDVSAALPGVAVAVALVPPLAAIGACIELGRADLASGAFLLFATNLVAIIFAGIVVLLWCGFVPARLLQRGRAAVWSGTVAVLVLLVAIGVPLTTRTLVAAENAEANRQVTEVVRDWLTPQPDLELSDLSVQGTVVRIDVLGPHEPVDVASMTRQVSSILGEGSTTTVRWSVRSTTDSSRPEPVDQPLQVDARDDEVATVRSVVDSWASEEAGIDVVGVSVGDHVVVVDVVGERAPTTVRALATALDRAVGRPIEAEVRFQQRVTLATDPAVDRRAAIAVAVSRVLAFSGIQVDAVRFGDSTTELVDEVVVDLSGPRPPDDPAAVADAVLRALAALDGFVDEPEITIRFTERRVIPWQTTTTGPETDRDPEAEDLP